MLWASPSAQAARFAALARWCDLDRRTILDAGCGRADLLDYLLHVGIEPAKYIGIEAVEAIAFEAEKKSRPMARIVVGDFIENPALLDQQADVVVFCGSLNTLSTEEFYQSLKIGWEKARRELAFNFLCSPRLASAKHLTWHRISDVLALAQGLTKDVVMDDGYREGDCTMVMRKI